MLRIVMMDSVHIVWLCVYVMLSGCMYVFLVAGYTNLDACCRRGFQYAPSSVTCEQYAMQSVKKHGPCRKALQDCCEINLKHISDNLQRSLVGQSDSFICLYMEELNSPVLLVDSY